MADNDPALNQPTGYVPPKVWTWDKENGGQFASINAPTAGAREEIKLERGKHPLQLYSLGTPNGVKVTIMLEELLEAGFDAEYDAWLINIGKGQQFGSDFVAINPNSKIPALLDYSLDPPLRLFESGSMLVYLAEKFGAILPTEIRKRTETLNWLMWQMGSAPFVGGGFGHFLCLCAVQDPVRHRPLCDGDQAAARRARQASGRQAVHHRRRDHHCRFAIYPWYGNIVRGRLSGRGIPLDARV